MQSNLRRISKGMTVMENNLKDNESKDTEQKQTADEDLALLLDTIGKEINGMTDSVLPEESLLDDTDVSGEDKLAELTRELLETDALESDLESVDDSAGPLDGVEPVDENPETKLDTLLDNQGEDEKMLVEKKDVSVQGPNKREAAPLNTSEVESTRPINDVVGKVEVVEEVAAIDSHLSKNPSSSNELKTKVEGMRDAEVEESHSDDSINELAVFMNKRMEEVLARLVEERMPAMVERTMIKTIKKILLSM